MYNQSERNSSNDYKTQEPIIIIHTLKRHWRRWQIIVAGILMVILGFVFSIFVLVTNIVKSSDAYKVAIQGIEQREDLLNEIGGLKGYGIMPTGNININNGFGEANLNIKVRGKKENRYVNAYLKKPLNGNWILIELNP